MLALTFTKVVILQVLLIEVYGADLRCPDNTQIDVTFFLDYPNYLGPDNWNKALQFVSDVIKQFKIGPYDARFAAVGYTMGAATLYDLRSLTDYPAFDKALKGPGTQSPQPVTDQVYNTITGWNMFSNKETARKSAPSVAVYITNGISLYWNRTITLLKSLNVKIVTVGIGSSVSVPVLKAQSSSTDDALLTASSDTLPGVKNKTVERICAAGKIQLTTPQATTQKTTTTLPPVQQQSGCSAYSLLTAQAYTTKTHLDCFKLCTANRLCYGYVYKVGISCQLNLMTGAVINTNDDETQVNPYITCPVKSGGCLVYSDLRVTTINFTNHKDCFNTCVVKPTCVAYTYSKRLRYCAHNTLDKTVIDPNIDKSTTAYLRCPKQ